MILADIQTTFSLVLTVLVLGLWGAGVCMFLLLRAVGRTLGDSYQKGGGNPQLVRNIVSKGSAHILKRLFLKLILKR